MALFRRTRSDSSRPLCGGTRSDGVGSGFVNSESGQGGDGDRQSLTWFTGGCDLDSTQINALMRNFSVARRLARRPVEDSLSAGFRVQGSVSGAAIDVLVGGRPEEKLEEPDPIAVWAEWFGVAGLVIEADSQARAHGLALWVYGVEDGRRSDEPMGSPQRLLWVRVASRAQVSVLAWGTDPNLPRFEEPTMYQVTFRRSGITAAYHWTRVQEWTGVELSTEELAGTQDNGGGSIFDLVWSALKGYGVSHQQALEALSLLSQGVWSNDNLARAIDGGNAKAVADHYQAATMGGGLYGDYVVSKGESYNIVGRPVVGIPEVGAMMRDALVVASEMSEPVLLGAAPSAAGLNNDLGGLIRSWLNHLAVQQPGRFGRPLARLWSVASRANNGPTGGVPILGLLIGWPDLWELTELERADVRTKNATARKTDLDSKVITIAEGRTDKTVIDEYDLTPPSIIEAATEPDVELEDIEIADAELMPPGESPIGMLAAAKILGRKSPGAARNFIAAKGVPLFRPGVAHVVFESHLRKALRESMV